jgi:hypothetical protein
MTNAVLSMKLLKPLMIVGAFYFFINFIATKIKGTPLYSFLHWQSYESFVIAAVMLFSFGLVYCFLCKVDTALKYKSLLAKNCK